uniref:Uncharacterized protein n=1 Tax=Acrobeloides nanus TaxID=290746 RepID=A0A914DG28_9BILA
MEQRIAKLQAEIAKLTCKSQDLLDNAVQLEKSKSELSRLKSFEKAHKWEEELLITKRLRVMAETSKNNLSSEHASLLVGLDNERQQNKMEMEKLKTENLRLQEIINAQKLCIETV